MVSVVTDTDTDIVPCSIWNIPGKNNGMVSFMMNETRNKKMNESSAGPLDEIVTSIIDRIHAQVKVYYAAPLKLLERFEALEDVLSGTVPYCTVLYCIAYSCF